MDVSNALKILKSISYIIVSAVLVFVIILPLIETLTSYKDNPKVSNITVDKKFFEILGELKDNSVDIGNKKN